MTVLALAACGGPGIAAPTPTGSPTSTPTTTPGMPTPTPTPTAGPPSAAQTATLLLVLPNFIGVSGDGGSLADYDYFTAVDTISSGLTGYFGFAPAVTHVEGQEDGVSYTKYDWEGFEVRDWDKPATRDPYIPEFQIYSAVGNVRGVSIETAGNSKVGDATDAVAALNSDVTSYSGEGGAQYTSVRVFPMEPVNGRYGPISLAVRLDGLTGGAIEFMLSPWPDMQM